ncbi:MAG: dockerin type I domain-containing protein [Candidatus Woesearchaeota archaeon]|nr:dockerin type I domain-containing protein [Candidatus Woesearchaeota archaeon]
MKWNALFLMAALILAVFFVAACSTTGEAAYLSGQRVSCIKNSTIGDVNSDKVISSTDAAMIFNMYLGKIPTPPNKCCADANKDGKITPGDALLVTNYYLGYNQTNSTGFVGNKC